MAVNGYPPQYIAVMSSGTQLMPRIRNQSMLLPPLCRNQMPRMIQIRLPPFGPGVHVGVHVSGSSCSDHHCHTSGTAEADTVEAEAGTAEVESGICSSHTWL